MVSLTFNSNLSPAHVCVNGSLVFMGWVWMGLWHGIIFRKKLSRWTFQIFSLVQQVWWFHSFKKKNQNKLLETLESFFNSNRTKMKNNVEAKNITKALLKLWRHINQAKKTWSVFFSSSFQRVWPGFSPKIILMPKWQTAMSMYLWGPRSRKTLKEIQHMDFRALNDGAEHGFIFIYKQFTSKPTTLIERRKNICQIAPTRSTN